jgi:hypothetical protein
MRLPRLLLAAMALTWVLVMLYPDPGVLVRSVRNYAGKDTAGPAVGDLARGVPDDPRLIEAYVLEERLPYAYDWRSAGVPWYFPTADEAARARRGDCESRAMLLAGLLRAKGIPHEVRQSLDHIWVEYPGKLPTTGENAARELLGRRDGRFFLQWPDDFDLGRELDDRLAITVYSAPPWRLAVLAAGLLLIVSWNGLVVLASPGRGERPPGLRARGAPTRLAAHAGKV